MSGNGSVYIHPPFIMLPLIGHSWEAERLTAAWC